MLVKDVSSCRELEEQQRRDRRAGWGGSQTWTGKEKSYRAWRHLSTAAPSPFCPSHL